MTAYNDRKQADETRMDASFQQIVELTRMTDLPFTLGSQFADFKVGRTSFIRDTIEVPADAVCKVRVLTDFRGECFRCFVVMGKVMPVDVEQYFNRKIFFTAKEAYDFILSEAREINNFFNRFNK